MLYQVLTRRNDVVQWRCVTLPTSDLHRARLDLHSVKRYNAGALLIAAESLSELARITQRLREADGDQVGDQLCAPEDATPFAEDSATPSSSRLGRSADRRWEMERGPGGDHDELYAFHAPTSEATKRAWARLLARVHRERRNPPDGPLTF